jgi:hypothetical protein
MTERMVSVAPVDNPQILRIRKRPLNLEAYRHPAAPRRAKERAFRNATIGDVGRMLKGNCFYLKVPEDCSPLIPFLHRINWVVSSRNDGTPSRAKVVGYLERNPLRQRDFCTMAGLGKQDPEAHAAILHYATVATAHYAKLNPDLYEAHQAMARKVLDQYRVEDTPFTSGIVNRDNVLPYHYDAGNFPNGEWSLMLGWKRDIGPDEAGNAGELVIPEWDLALAIEDNTLSGFDGQVSLHGVTPFRKLSRDAYRYTIVYYSKVGMWQCLNVEEEIARAQQARTRKELRRYEARSSTPTSTRQA